MDLPILAMDPHQVHKSQVALLALPYYILGLSQYSGPGGTDPASPLTEVVSAGAVLGLIGVGPLIFQRLPLTLRITGAPLPSENTKSGRLCFPQLGLEPNHTGLTAQSLFFLEELRRVKRSDT